MSSIRSRPVTVSKLAWLASSGAAVHAASCLSGLPVPLEAGRSAIIVREHKGIQLLSGTVAYTDTETQRLVLLNGL